MRKKQSPDRQRARRGPVEPRTVYLVVGFLFACATANLLAPTDPVAATLGVLPALGFFVAIVVGVRRNRPETPLPWYLFCGSVAAGLAAAVWRLTFPGSIVADFIAVPAYFFLIAGLVIFVRRTRALKESGAVFDAFVLMASWWVLAWSVFVVPVVTHADAGRVEGVMAYLNPVYPLMSSAWLALLALLLLCGAGKSKAFALFATGLAGVFASDVLFWFADSGRIQIDLLQAQAFYPFAYALTAGAALHPSMVELTRPILQKPRLMRTPRSMFLGLSIFLPIMILVFFPPESTSHVVVMALSGVILSATVVARLRKAVGSYTAIAVELKRQALSDSLTGLPNRAALEAHLDARLDPSGGPGSGVAVAFLDLDGFKSINDAWGHTAGDALLAKVGERLAGLVGERDIVARIGGDEFVVAVEADSADAAAELGMLLTLTLGTPFESEYGEVNVMTACGVTYAAPGDGSTADGVLHDADVAMYQAKATGPGQYLVFDEVMRDASRDRAALETDLRGALKGNEIVLGYKPVVEAKSGNVVAVNTYLRWAHPTRGLLASQAFLPVAEDTGMTIPLGTFALNESLDQLRRWQTMYDAPLLAVSVTVGARQLRDPSFVRTVRAALERSGVAPRSLWLGLQEAAFLDDPAVTLRALEELSEMGVKLCAENFGAGHSSLGHLADFPIDQVRLNGEFVRGIGRSRSDEAIVAAVVSMGRSLGLEVVAERVDTREQLEHLIGLGVPLVQGLTFSDVLSPVSANGYLSKSAGTLGERTVDAWIPILKSLDGGAASPAPQQGDLAGLIPSQVRPLGADPDPDPDPDPGTSCGEASTESVVSPFRARPESSGSLSDLSGPPRPSRAEASRTGTRRRGHLSLLPPAEPIAPERAAPSSGAPGGDDTSDGPGAPDDDTPGGGSGRRRALRSV